MPLTGTLVASGVSVRSSILLADSLFDRSDLASFTFEDDGFLPKNSVSIAKKFIDQKMDAIIIFGTPTAFAVVPVTEQAKTPLLAITIVDKVVQGKQYALRECPKCGSTMRVVAFIQNHHEIEKIMQSLGIPKAQARLD